MHSRLSAFLRLAAFLSLATASLALAVNPGSYLITNVQFPAQTVTGTDVAREGIPITTFNVRYLSNHMEFN